MAPTVSNRPDKLIQRQKSRFFGLVSWPRLISPSLILPVLSTCIAGLLLRLGATSMPDMLFAAFFRVIVGLVFMRDSSLPTIGFAGALSLLACCVRGSGEALVLGVPLILLCEADKTRLKRVAA
jgi:hypothetical protein